MLLGKDPALKALEMNESYRSLALAGNDQRILIVFIVTPTDSALGLVGSDVRNVFDSLDLHGLLKFLLIELPLGHLLLVTSEVLHSEPHSTKFNSVKFLDLVVIFAGLILQ